MTGINADSIMGKGNYEYSTPLLWDKAADPY